MAATKHCSLTFPETVLARQDITAAAAAASRGEVGPVDIDVTDKMTNVRYTTYGALQEFLSLLEERGVRVTIDFPQQKQGL